MNAVAVINHWLHLMSVVIWIGGLAFVVMTLNPSLREKFPQESIKALTQSLQARYYRTAGILLILILVTGGLNVHFVHEQLVPTGGFKQVWLLGLGVKLILATGLISIYLLNLLYKNEPQPEGQTEIPWARASFLLGVLTILTAAFLKHAH
jgi:putative copper export protein